MKRLRTCLMRQCLQILLKLEQIPHSSQSACAWMIKSSSGQLPAWWALFESLAGINFLACTILMAILLRNDCQSQSSSLGGRGEGLRSSIGLGDMSSPLPINSSWGGHGDASNNAAVQNVINAYGSPGLPGISIPPLNQVLLMASTVQSQSRSRSYIVHHW